MSGRAWLLRAQGVSAWHAGGSQPVLHSLDLDLAPGALTLVLGADAAGKTTLLRVLADVGPDLDGGRLAGLRLLAGTVGGERALELPPAGARHDRAAWRSRVLMVPEDPSLALLGARGSVEREVALALEWRGTQPARIRDRVARALETWGIADLAQRPAQMLSRGEQARVAMAAAEVLEPDVMLLDDPLAGLDADGRRAVMDCVDRGSERGLAVCAAASGAGGFLTSGLAPDGRPADRAVVLEGGAGVLEGQLSDVAVDGRLVDLGVQPALVVPAQGNRQLVRLGFAAPRVDDALRAGRAAGAAAQAVPDYGAPTVRRAALELVDASWRTPEARWALRGVGLSLAHGEVVAVIGPNGAGKTSLLRLAAGLSAPAEGRALAGGDPIAGLDAKQRTRRVAISFARPEDQIVESGVRREVALGPRLMGLPENVAHAVAAAAESACGLEDRADRHPYDLSRADRRWVAIAGSLACALGGGARLVALDEPEVGLDGRGRARLLAVIRGLAGLGIAVLLASHDMDLVAAAADRVAVLHRGRLMAVGPRREVLQDRHLLASAHIDAPPALRAARAAGLPSPMPLCAVELELVLRASVM